MTLILPRTAAGPRADGLDDRRVEVARLCVPRNSVWAGDPEFDSLADGDTIGGWPDRGQDAGGYLHPVDGLVSLGTAMPVSASTPSTPATSITGDMSIMCLVSRAWVTVGVNTSGTVYGGKWSATNSQRSYFLRSFGSTSVPNRICFTPSVDGVTTSDLVQASVALPVTSDWQWVWLLAEYRLSDRRVQFFYRTAGDLSGDTVPTPGQFTQLGTDQTATSTAIYAGAAPVTWGDVGGVGGSDLGGLLKVRRGLIYSGRYSGGAASCVHDNDMRRDRLTYRYTEDAADQPVQVNMDPVADQINNAWIDGTGLRMPGQGVGGYLSVAPGTTMNFTTGLDVAFSVDAGYWNTPAGVSAGIIQRGVQGATNSAWRLIRGTGATNVMRLDLGAVGGGTYTRFLNSPAMDTTKSWYRVTFDATSGVATWYQSNVYGTWGAAVGTSAPSVGNIPVSSEATPTCWIGGYDSSTTWANPGHIYRVVGSGTIGGLGAPAFDIDFTVVPEGSFSFTSAVGGLTCTLLTFGGNEPVFRRSVAALNDQPGIQFTAASKQGLDMNVVDARAAQPYTVIVVGTARTGNARPLVSTGGGGNSRLGTTSADRYSFNTDGASIIQVGANDGAVHMWRGYANGANSELWLDEVLIAKGSLASASITRLDIGCTLNSGWMALWHDGYIGYAATFKGNVVDAGNWSELKDELSRLYDLALAVAPTFDEIEADATEIFRIADYDGTALTWAGEKGVATFAVGTDGARITTDGLVLPGATGCFASSPDSADLSITGDIDLRVKVALVDWTPTSNQSLISKWNSTPQLSYQFYLGIDGKLYLVWSNDGTTIITKTSSVVTGVADGATKWARVTLDVNNGAAGSDTKFWLSDDGSAWSQLGTTIVTAGTTSIFDGTEILGIGAQSGGTTNFANGTFYQAQIRNNILNDGTGIVFNVDFVNATPGRQYIANQGTNFATVTINGNSAPTDETNTTEDEFRVAGLAASYISVPDNAALRVIGDIGIAVRQAPLLWPPGSTRTWGMNKLVTLGQYNYDIFTQADGRLTFRYSTDGTALVSVTSSVAMPFAEGTSYWTYVTRNATTGNVNFYYAADAEDVPSVWTQVGATVAGAAGAIFAGTSQFQVESSATNNVPSRWKRTIVYPNLTQTAAVIDVDARYGDEATFSARSGIGFQGSAGLVLPGMASVYASTPDTAAVSQTGDFTIAQRMSMPVWATGTGVTPFSKRSGGADRSWSVTINGSGVWQFNGSTDGSTLVNASFVDPGLVNGTTYWWMMDRRSSDGRVRFFIAPDSATLPAFGSFVQYGGDQIGPIGALFDAAATLDVSAVNAGTNNPLPGTVKRAILWNGLYSGGAATIQYDADFTAPSQFSPNFVESSANAAIVTMNPAAAPLPVATVNRASSGQKTQLLTCPSLQFDTFKYLDAGDVDALDLALTDSMSIAGVFRVWGTPGADMVLVGKKTSTTTSAGWTAYYSTSRTVAFRLGDGTNTCLVASAAVTSGDKVAFVAIRDVANDVIRLYINGVASTPVTDSCTATLANSNGFKMGRFGSSGAGYLDGEWLSDLWIWRQALTPAEALAVSTELWKPENSGIQS